MGIITSLNNQVRKIFTSSLLKNSSWGILAQISQTIFLTLFFIILARKYNTHIFAIYIIANALYQLVSAFSTMGLGQWFIREFFHAENKEQLTNRFLKMQAYFGFGFYIVNVLLAYLIYDDQLTRNLILLMGVNVIFDNVVNAIRCLNIASMEQKKTFIILTIEVVLKFLTACILYFYPLSIISLSIILIAIRFLTLNLFLTVGSSNSVSIYLLYKHKIKFVEVKELLLNNWAFIIIGGVAVINWRIANIIISKALSSFDLANYEISFKVFSIAQIIPIVFSTSVFPILVKAYTEKAKPDFIKLYKNIYLFYTLFGLLAYTFVYSFSGDLIPLAFGSAYKSNVIYTQQMFLTILLFPTALLQANLLVAMKLEKLDMMLNIIALAVNVSLCFFGLKYFQSLATVNYSILTSFLVFHILQDIVLVRKGMVSLFSTLVFYVSTILIVCVYMFLSKIVNPYLLFSSTWFLILASMMFQRKPNLIKILAGRLSGHLNTADSN